MGENFHIYSLLATIVLGSVLIAIIYHSILYIFIRDYLVRHYIVFLFFLGIYTAYVAGVFEILLGKKIHDYFRFYLAEGSLMLYLFFYNYFVFKAINLNKTKHPVLYYLWNGMIWLILIYGVCISLFVTIYKADYHNYIFFRLIRLIVFAIAIALMFMYSKLKPNLFQKIIYYGSVTFLLFGFTSAFMNHMEIYDPVSPIEWLVIGGFVDIIFFSAALNFRIRKTIYNLSKNLLDNANEKIKIQEELLQKQQDLENERRRIALDMHDDLGSGLTKINYLAQRNFTTDSIHENLKKIRQTSSDLIENMSNIIWAMKQENDSLQDLMSYIKIYAADYLESNEIELKIKMPEIRKNIEINGNIRRNIFLIIKEILHNMVKHSKTKSAEITITYNNNIKIDIVDFGVGFKCDSINISKGNGLGNMKYRVQKLNGDIVCNSSEMGTSYTIQIPFNKIET